jgi:hypothetical protein
MRVTIRIFAVLTALTAVAPLLLGLMSAALDYRGVCPGFTDGEWPCSFGEYATTEATFALALLPVVVPLLLIGWGALGGWWLIALRRGRPRSPRH